jgi:multiple sugar transport system permease protein
MFQKLQNSRNALGFLFMFPAAVLLVLFLTYPLGLGVWLGFTDAKVGRPGEWVGIENYEFLPYGKVFKLIAHAFSRAPICLNGHARGAGG